jgi:Nup53/35/40-type RNA recognition motif
MMRDDTILASPGMASSPATTRGSSIYRRHSTQQQQQQQQQQDEDDDGLDFAIPTESLSSSMAATPLAANRHRDSRDRHYYPSPSSSPSSSENERRNHNNNNSGNNNNDDDVDASGGVFPLPSSSADALSETFDAETDRFYQQPDMNASTRFDERWVTVFGFSRDRTTEVLHGFQKYGEIEQHRMGTGNWLHMRYATKLQAQRALSKNGKILNGDLMLGVAPCIDESAWLKQQQHHHSDASSSPSSSSAHRLRPAAATLSATMPLSAIGNAPSQSQGFWTLFCEHVLGI